MTERIKQFATLTTVAVAATLITVPASLESATAGISVLDIFPRIRNR